MLERYNIITEKEVAEGLERTAAYLDAPPSTTNIVSLRAEGSQLTMRIWPTRGQNDEGASRRDG